MKRLCVYAAALACLVVAPMAIAGRAAQATTTNPDISGFWELNFDSRQVPRASLLPSVTRAKIDARAKGDAYARRWCNLLGVPFVMDPGRPLDIRQGATAVIIVGEIPRRRATSTRIERLTSARTSWTPRPTVIPSRIGREPPWWSTRSASTGNVGSPPSRVADTARRNRGWSSDTAC